MNTRRLKPLFVGLLASAVLAGCASYVKREEFDAAVSELRAADQDANQRMAALAVDLGAVAKRMDDRFADHDFRIALLDGALRVDMTAHFAFGDSTLRDSDREALGQFAAVLSGHSDQIAITVEGYADPAGSKSYNERLGLRRAESVRAFLVEQGVDGERVRAVSYGEAPERQVLPGAWGERGAANRRVALVVDAVPASG